MRFHDFYTTSNNGQQIIQVSMETCNATLATYQKTTNRQTCDAQLSCIVDNLSPPVAASMSTASILLGLTPVILATMGPTLAEASLLSVYRPGLALILSLGSPTVFFERLAAYGDPLECLKTGSGLLSINRLDIT